MHTIFLYEIWTLTHQHDYCCSYPNFPLPSLLSCQSESFYKVIW